MSDNREISVTENTNPIIADLDCGEGANPDAGKDICALRDKNLNGFGEDTDKPTSYTLSLGDALTSEIDSSQGDKLEVSAVMGADSDGDGSYLIRVSDDGDWTKTDKLFFEGDVAFGESFTASEAAFGTSFGSETYVHILSSDGSTVLQTINFHTSCSAPLVIGDQYGSVSLEGASLVGKDSGTVYEVGGTSAPGDEGVTYSIQDGPGSDLFEVNADGEVSFKEAPDFEDPQGILDADGNPTNNYEVVVLATLDDGSVIEKPVEVCVEDDCIKVTENTTGPIVDLDCGEGANPDAGKDICALTDKNLNGFGEDTDKPTSYTLSLGDALTSEIDSSQGDKLEVSAVMGADSDGDGSYLIRVSDDGDWTKTDKLFFEGDVAFGESFTASEAAFGTSFGSETYVHILSSDGSTVLQTINFHTSCSAPLVIGDQYGSVSLEGASLVGKDSGTVYEVGGTSAPGDEGVTYSIQDGPGSDLFEVNADGEVSFKEAPDFEDPQGILDADGNPTNNYEVVVLATLDDGSVIEKPVEVCVEDDCIKVTENTTGPIVDLDCGEGANPDAGKDICALTDKNLNGFGEDTDKPTSYTLSLGDALTSEIDSSQGDKLEVSAVMGADSDGDGSYLIRVSDDGDWTKTDKLFFEGDVAFGESFTASEAAFGTSFGSETYVHILSSDGSTVLQTINFHTSCSAPLVIGDQYGSVSLEGASLVGKDSGTVYEVGGTSAPGDEGVTYSIQDGPGSDLFEVNAGGEVSFKEAPDFEDPQGILDADGNPTNNYEVVVLATLDDGSVIEKPVEVCVEDQDCIKVLENNNPGILADLDCEDKDPQNPDEGLELCMERDSLKDAGIDTTKFTELTLSLRFNDDGTLATDDQSEQGSKLDLEVDNTGTDDANGSYRVIVSGKDDPSDTSEVFFDATVGSGDPITALASAGGKNEFGSETYVHIIDDDGTLLQTVNFHTSCSAPIAIGDGYYGVQLDGASFANKDTQETISYGVTNAAPREVVYEITGGDGFDAATGTSPFFDVDPQTGEVTLAFSPDFENPLDDNGDNNYFVEVTGYLVNADGSREVCEVKPVEICIEDVVELGSIAGRYFCDLDGDGLDNNNGDEPGEAGVQVFLQLRDAAGNISFVADTVTDANGDYVFEDLPAGEYRVIFAPVAGKVFVDPNVGQMGDMDPADDSDVVAQNPVTGRGATDFIQLADGEDRTDVDAGVEFTASLGDLVFEDANANGIQDAGEAGIAGVTVNLLDAAGNVLDTTNTGDDPATAEIEQGFYEFADLDPGDYRVQFVQPSGFTEVSPANVGGDDTVDSDGLISEIVSLDPGENDPTVDQGFYNLASLGDFVFEDLNGDGIQDGDEPGVDGVTVELKDAGGTVVATTTTANGGAYSFTGLMPGTYSVAFTAPAGFAFTTANAGGDDTVDSDANPAGMTGQVTLTSGEFNGTLDAGIVALPGSIAGRYFVDAGTPPDPALDCDGLDNDGDGTAESSAPVVGATVELLDAAGNVVATTTTGVDGAYSFTNLPAGDYSVRFAPTDGAKFTDQDVDGNVSDDIDSDVDPNSGETGTISLAPGQDVTDIDAGICPLASLGDTVFEDANANGIQDAGEAGIAGVTVNLLDAAGNVLDTTTTGDDPATAEIEQGFYEFADLDPGDYRVQFVQPSGFTEVSPANVGGDDTVDSDGLISEIVSLDPGENDPTVDQGFYNLASLGDFVFEDLNGDGIQDAGEPGVDGVTVELKDAGGTVVATTTTANGGAYSFTGLMPGTYSVAFTAPAGFAFTTLNAGGDDALDSDADPAMGGMTQQVTLTSGEFNGTLDAGIVALPGSIAGRYFVDAGTPPDPALDCDGLDNDGDGTAESSAPVVGATVELLDAAGNVVATTTTGVDGAYSFTNLPAGDYSVRFAPTDGAKFTDQDVDGNVSDDIDSDVDPNSGETGTISLAPGQDVTDIDAGICPLASLGDTVFEDANANGIQDAGEAGIAGVTVNLLDAAGNVLDTTTTGDDPATAEIEQGFYEFADLDPGDYRVQFVQPSGFTEVSPANVGGDDTVDSDGLISEIVSLDPGENDRTVDQGFYNLASLGDFVFEDLNGDGIQDAGEPGVDGVTVELKDAGGTVVATTTTANGGAYSFTGLMPGTYSVAFTAPAGFAFTTLNAGGDDALDSDADPAMGGMTQQVTLTSGEFNGTLDAGIVADNADPEATPDNGKGCADEPIKVDLSDNISDPDGDPVTITAINGIAIADGQIEQVDLDGVGGRDPVNVTLNGDTFIFDGEDAYADLDIGDEETAQFTYTVSDGKGGEATSTIDVTFCGDANDYASLAASFPETGNFIVDFESVDDPDAFAITLTGTDDDRFDGVTFENAYCLSFTDPIRVDVEIPGDVFDVEGPLPGVFDPDQVSGFNGQSAQDNLDLIQWIVAQNWESDGTYGAWDIQFAIWSLTDDVDPADFNAYPLANQTDVDAILAAAAGNEGFSFEGDGGVAGAIVDPNPETLLDQQPFIISFDFDDYDCIC